MRSYLALSMGSTRLSAFTRATLIAGLAVLFCLLAQLVSAGLGNQLLIWPASGVAFAFGWRYGRGLGAAGCGWASSPGRCSCSRDLLFSLTVSLASTIGPLVAIHFLRRMADWKPPEYRLDAIVRFIAVALTGSAIDQPRRSSPRCLRGSPACRLPAPATAASSATALHPAHLFLSVWLVDGLGMMLVAPALLAWIDDAVPEADGGQQSVGHLRPVQPADDAAGHRHQPVARQLGASAVRLRGAVRLLPDPRLVGRAHERTRQRADAADQRPAPAGGVGLPGQHAGGAALRAGDPGVGHRVLRRAGGAGAAGDFRGPAARHPAGCPPVAPGHEHRAAERPRPARRTRRPAGVAVTGQLRADRAARHQLRFDQRSVRRHRRDPARAVRPRRC